jgi:hypothetical protein
MRRDETRGALRRDTKGERGEKAETHKRHEEHVREARAEPALIFRRGMILWVYFTVTVSIYNLSANIRMTKYQR